MSTTPGPRSSRALRAASLSSTFPSATTAPTLIAYGASPQLMAECEQIARDTGISHVEVKHLHAACTALKANPCSFVLASTQLRPWDREVLEDQVARAGVALRWIGPGDAPETAVSAIRAWAQGALRRSRTGR